MALVASIDPVTRIEGHMKVEIKVDTLNGTQQVVDAWSTGTMFRGLENVLVGRAPTDAQHVTERICGVCPAAHAMAAVLALESAAGITAPTNGRLVRNLVMGANFVSSHILHFYTLALLDFIDGPGMAPWAPAWSLDRRFDAATSSTLLNHYLAALDARRKADELGAIFGARFPHPPTFTPGGVTTSVTAERISSLKALLAEVMTFVQDTYVPDVELLASVYPDYFQLGRGPGNLLAFGAFEQNNQGTSKLFAPGRVVNGGTSVQTIDLNAITEEVSSSWYAASTDKLNPASGATTPEYPKTNAYSWLKAPRYAGQPYECGPLARMWINGDYRNGISIMDRHLARAYEAVKIGEAMGQWANELNAGVSARAAFSTPAKGSAVGLTEAPRGALGHWLTIATSKISAYQVITPTCWNGSPRDGAGVAGPLEQALVGLPVQDPAKPVEVMRAVHAYDPCLDCAVH